MVSVALANKTARIAWAVLARNQSYPALQAELGAPRQTAPYASQGNARVVGRDDEPVELGV